jgi:hypothetical protein
VSHFVLSELNGPWFIFFGLAAWAVAYVFLTRVITPDSIGDLMTLIIAVLPVFTFIIALAVTVLSFTAKHQHVAQGTVFAILAALALIVTIVQYMYSKGQRSEIRDALQKTIKRPHPLRSTILIITWGLFGAILVFASELGLIFGGWQFLQGSRILGLAWAGSGVVIVLLGLRGGSGTRNPIRRAVLALQDHDQDNSVTLINRLLEPARRQDQALLTDHQPAVLSAARDVPGVGPAPVAASTESHGCLAGRQPSSRGSVASFSRIGAEQMRRGMGSSACPVTATSRTKCPGNVTRAPHS